MYKYFWLRKFENPSCLVQNHILKLQSRFLNSQRLFCRNKWCEKIQLKLSGIQKSFRILGALISFSPTIFYWLVMVTGPSALHCANHINNSLSVFYKILYNFIQNMIKPVKIVFKFFWNDLFSSFQGKDM